MTNFITFVTHKWFGVSYIISLEIKRRIKLIEKQFKNNNKFKIKRVF